MGAEIRRSRRDRPPSILPSGWVTRVETRVRRLVHAGFVGWGREVDREKEEEEGMNTGEVEEDGEEHDHHYHYRLLWSLVHRTTRAGVQHSAPLTGASR